MKQQLIAGALAVCLLCAPAASAHWADSALEYAAETAMLPPEAAQTAAPATRAELAYMVTQLLGLETAAPLDAFPDVPDSHPYAQALQRALALGLLRGIDGKLCPDEPVTRQQAFVIFSRAFALPDGSLTALDRFFDRDQLGGWAAPATAGLVQAGLVQGSGGLLRPQDPVSLEELAQLLLNLTGRVCGGSGGTAILPASAALPEGLSIDGDLYLCRSGGSSSKLKDAAVSGRLVIRGSGELCLDNAAAGQLLVCDGGIRLRTASMAQAVSCCLSAVSAGLEVTAEPVPDSPTLNAVLHLSCSEPLPLGAARQLQLQWLLGETVLGEESVVLADSADLRLAAPIRYDQPLPKGQLRAVLSLGSERITVAQPVNLHAELAVPKIETIQVQATVQTGTALYADMQLRQYAGWVNQGTTATYVNYCSGLSAKLALPDGRIGWVRADAIAISQENYVRPTDYTTFEKESYANQSGYTSPTPYLVWISLKTQRVNVFLGTARQWKLAQCFTVATGKNSTPTIAGVFAYQYRQEQWDFGDYYVRPVLVFNGGHAFHSRTYTPSGALLDARLGQPVSAGCIRMRDEDVAWLDQYLPLQSTVVVY